MISKDSLVVTAASLKQQKADWTYRSFWAQFRARRFVSNDGLVLSKIFTEKFIIN